MIKQADVVMLVHLLWARFPPAVREANFRFYEPRTDHGSSLSPPVHAAVAARLGLAELAMRYFRQTAEIDLANNMGNAAGGVHVAALGGLWQAAVFGFAGLDLAADPPVLRPRLPPGWCHVAFAARWRGQRLDLVARSDDGGDVREGGRVVIGPLSAVIAPIDGAAHALVALPVARTLAALEGAALHVVHVMPGRVVPAEALAGELGVPHDRLRDAVLHVRVGDPAVEILRVAAEHAPSVVVLCSRTRGSALAGSVRR